MRLIDCVWEALESILVQCHISIPSENVRKSIFFWRFQEIEKCDIGLKYVKPLCVRRNFKNFYSIVTWEWLRQITSFYWLMLGYLAVLMIHALSRHPPFIYWHREKRRFSWYQKCFNFTEWKKSITSISGCKSSYLIRYYLKTASFWLLLEYGKVGYRVRF